MVDNVNQERWSLGDLEACTYCTKRDLGRVITCGDYIPTLPYTTINPNYGKNLDSIGELPLRGCERIKYNGVKIPAFLF